MRKAARGMLPTWTPLVLYCEPAARTCLYMAMPCSLLYGTRRVWLAHSHDCCSSSCCEGAALIVSHAGCVRVARRCEGGGEYILHPVFACGSCRVTSCIRGTAAACKIVHLSTFQTVGHCRWGRTHTAAFPKHGDAKQHGFSPNRHPCNAKHPAPTCSVLAAHLSGRLSCAC